MPHTLWVPMDQHEQGHCSRVSVKWSAHLEIVSASVSCVGEKKSPCFPWVMNKETKPHREKEQTWSHNEVGAFSISPRQAAIAVCKLEGQRWGISIVLRSCKPQNKESQWCSHNLKQKVWMLSGSIDVSQVEQLECSLDPHHRSQWQQQCLHLLGKGGACVHQLVFSFPTCIYLRPPAHWTMLPTVKAGHCAPSSSLLCLLGRCPHRHT